MRRPVPPFCAHDSREPGQTQPLFPSHSNVTSDAGRTGMFGSNAVHMHDTHVGLGVGSGVRDEASNCMPPPLPTEPTCSSPMEPPPPVPGCPARPVLISPLPANHPVSFQSGAYPGLLPDATGGFEASALPDTVPDGGFEATMLPHTVPDGIRSGAAHGLEHAPRPPHPLEPHWRLIARAPRRLIVANYTTCTFPAFTMQVRAQSSARMRVY